MIDSVEYLWTDGSDKDFREFYRKTEDYYSRIVGGACNRAGFIPYNLSESISDVLIAYHEKTAVGCAGLKRYSESDAEIKRVWVEPEYRGRHIASHIMDLIEKRGREDGYARLILQTRPIMTDAVKFYEGRGYVRIENYPPYDKLEGAVCMALDCSV